MCYTHIVMYVDINSVKANTWIIFVFIFLDANQPIMKVNSRSPTCTQTSVQR